MFATVSTTDEQIAKNFLRLRGDRSQKEIASLMQARGWKWSQATVWAIEKAERPIRLAEAVDLEEILGLFPNLTQLVESPKRVTIESEIRALSDAEERLEQAALDYERERYELAIKADQLPEEEQIERERLISAYLKVSSKDVVANAHAQLEEESEEYEEREGVTHAWTLVHKDLAAGRFRGTLKEAIRGERQEA